MNALRFFSIKKHLRLNYKFEMSLRHWQLLQNLQLLILSSASLLITIIYIGH